MQKVNQISSTACLEILLVFLLAGMAVMVFVNVVMRYGFNSGLAFRKSCRAISSSGSTFIGAVVVLREQPHHGHRNRCVRCSAAAAGWSDGLRQSGDHGVFRRSSSRHLETVADQRQHDGPGHRACRWSGSMASGFFTGARHVS